MATAEHREGYMIEYKRLGLVRIGYIHKLHPNKTIMAANDESGEIEYHIVKPINIIGVYNELPHHIKTFR